MNIFVLDRDPEVAARYHCDKHVCKMILEAGQMLCTAHWVAWMKKLDIKKSDFKRVRDLKEELKKRVPFFSMLFVVFIFVLISIDPPIVLASLAFAYIISGPLLWVKKRIKN